MRKLLIICLTVLLAMPMVGQSKYSHTSEWAVGVGVGPGPRGLLAYRHIFNYKVGQTFAVGMGAGLRFASPCVQYNSRDGGAFKREVFLNEIGIPLFIRGGYESERFFANLDIGYSIGIISIPDLGLKGGGGIIYGSPYKGIFVEPHVGLYSGRRTQIALGMLWQQSIVTKGIYEGDHYSSSYSVSFTPAITVLVGHVF